jgi:hypothetical protein
VPKALGGWQALEEKHLFDIEYWDLEQAKLRKDGRLPAVHRRDRARHRRCFRHRQGVRGVVPAARRRR